MNFRRESEISYTCHNIRRALWLCQTWIYCPGSTLISPIWPCPGRKRKIRNRLDQCSQKRQLLPWELCNIGEFLRVKVTTRINGSRLHPGRKLTHLKQIFCIGVTSNPFYTAALTQEPYTDITATRRKCWYKWVRWMRSQCTTLKWELWESRLTLESIISFQFLSQAI